MARLISAFAFLLAVVPGFALDQAAYAAAVELYRNHRPIEATHAFEVLAVTEPASADIQFYLGRLALQRDDAGQAVMYLEKATALAPNDSRIYLRLGDAYGMSAQKAGLFSQIAWARKCKAAYEQAIALDPKNVDAHWGLMEYCRQAPGLVGGGMAAALVQAREIKQLDAARGRLAIASLYIDDKQFALAAAEFDEALRVDPLDYAALYQTGRLAAVSGERLDRGLATLQQCLALAPPEGQPPHAAAQWRIGVIWEKKGDKAAARSAYEAALKLDPKFAPAVESLKKL